MLKKLQYEETQSVAWLIHLRRTLDNSIMCQAAKGSNCPLLENSIRCPLTQFDERPLACLLMMIAHWLKMSKNNSMLLLLWWKLLTAALAVDRPLANLLMLTADDKCPLVDEDAHWLLRWCCWDFQSDNHLSISLTFSPLCQLKGETIFSKIYLNSPPSGVGEFHCYTPLFNCMRVPSSVHCWLHYVWL